MTKDQIQKVRDELMFYTIPLRKDGFAEAIAILDRALAAAPELLKALQAIEHSMAMAQVHGNDWRRELKLSEAFAKQAIAKATGEQ